MAPRIINGDRDLGAVQDMFYSYRLAKAQDLSIHAGVT